MPAGGQRPKYTAILAVPTGPIAFVKFARLTVEATYSSLRATAPLTAVTNYGDVKSAALIVGTAEGQVASSAVASPQWLVDVDQRRYEGYLGSRATCRRYSRT